MAIISNETYQQQRRERERQERERLSAAAHADSTGSPQADSASSPQVDSISSPQSDSRTARQTDAACSAKPQAVIPARTFVLTKVELPARAAQVAPELESGEVDEAQRTVEVALSLVSPAQAAALRALVEGRPLQEAAAEAGVDRGTLYRWRTQDVQFMAALNAWRNETQSHARDRMLAMADKAIGAVSKSLDEGDGRLGLRVLKDLECNRAGPVEPMDPDALERKLQQGFSPQVKALMEVMQKMTPDQSKRLVEIVQQGIDADNARLAREAATPAESIGGERVEFAGDERVESASGELPVLEAPKAAEEAGGAIGALPVGKSSPVRGESACPERVEAATVKGLGPPSSQRDDEATWVDL